MTFKIRYFFLILFLAGFAAYSNSFQAPFIFDDIHVIVKNFGLRDLWNLKEVLLFDSPGRPFLNLTFAINFTAGGLNPIGYHVVNFLLHVGTSLLVFLLLWEILRREEVESGIYPALGAMLFLLHPIQVGAVTYVSSRSSILAVFLYLLSFLLVIRRPLKWGFLFFLALFFFALAVFTKEISVTLPALLTIYFWQYRNREDINRSIPFLALFWGMLPVFFIYRYFVTGHPLEELHPERFLTPLIYFQTQLSVVAFGYIPRLFVPINQIFDGASQWKMSALNLEVIGGGIILLVLAVFAVWNFKRKRVLSFSILWFLTALSVTCSFWPILDAYVERRLYIAMPAFCLAVSYLYYLADIRWPNLQKQFRIALIAVLVVFSFLTFQRNSLHAEPLLLWKDTAGKTWGKARIYAGMAYEYIRKGEYKKAEETIHFGMKAFPENVPLKISYCRLLGMKSDFTSMERRLKKIRPVVANDVAQVYNLYGLLEGEKGKYRRAMEYFQKALEVVPGLVDARANMAILLWRQGRTGDAIALLKNAIKRNPYEADYHFQLGNMMLGSNRAIAFREYKLALELDPNHIDAARSLETHFRQYATKPKAM